MTKSNIGTLNEKPLHAALKKWYAKPNDQFEVLVDGFVIDIVRDDLLVEIQTRSFAALKRKLAKLTATHRVRLVHPIAQEKWIIKLARDGSGELKPRKSPKRGSFVHIFAELVSIPDLMAQPNFSLDVLLIQEEEIRHYVGRRAAWRRRGWRTQERRLRQVVAQQRFETPADLATLIPDTLADPFTTAELATALAHPRRLAQKMAYCLREMEVIRAVGNRNRAILYTRTRENRA